MTQTKNSMTLSSQYGFYMSTFGVVLLLLWLGIFKFTATEAMAIKPLIANHPLSSWLYRLLSAQTISSIVGVIEILVALLILLSLKFNQLRKYTGIGVCIIFTMTLSYLFTSPNMLRYVDGVPVTDFFILKDILFLGYGINLLQSANK
ncbi:DUF417 family protein [Sphingobacterium athyrii]|uniref:DUF417 domain-containing protein n=1 Tax=Sphingobacterium athyrii TaxID=2152717 RepID=A0A363NM50_9SPHI|nr:DUF417 family protein [Sphingobacterium athyrii]PUV21844.1 hypothetical protein DCO56_25815 [Sphingobacterium athyrii]